MNIKKKIRYKLDWFLYSISWKAINRICNESPGMGYLLELHIKEWRGNISKTLKEATEFFYKELKMINEDKGK